MRSVSVLVENAVAVGTQIGLMRLGFESLDALFGTDGCGNDVLGRLGQWDGEFPTEPGAALDFRACPVVISRSVGVSGETEFGEIDGTARLALIPTWKSHIPRAVSESTDEFGR